MNSYPDTYICSGPLRDSVRTAPHTGMDRAVARLPGPFRDYSFNAFDRSLIAVVSPFGAFRFGSRRYALILQYLGSTYQPLCSILENEFRELLLKGQSRLLQRGCGIVIF